MDPLNRAQAECREQDEEDDVEECLPRRILDHLPDLQTAEGILDVLALRSFIIIYLALASDAYDNMEKSTVGPCAWALPVDSRVWVDVMCAWSLAVDLDEYIQQYYDFSPRDGCDLEDFDAAADFAVTGMAASMYAYRQARKDLSYPHGLPQGFTPAKFTEQLEQMLGRFDLYRTSRQLGEEEEKCIAHRDAHMSKTEFNKLGLVAEYHLLSQEDENLWLLEWDCTTLPFTLTRKA
ncbi:hypothetical protein C8F04DRAFT_1158367 [Mycena alexandri]|nr:hypothetical protein C8F04DRAFT_1158367 [Mycena alexandri]